MRRWIASLALLALGGCATGGWIWVPTYRYYYFYEPRIAAAPGSTISHKQEAGTIDLAFERSANTLSITTMPSRGDLGVIMGPSGDEKDYTGFLALDALAHGRSIPMRLWVAASCRGESWVIHPSKIHLFAGTYNPSEIPLVDNLQPLPSLLHPDSQVFTGHWQYRPLDSSRDIRCENGVVAFTAAFNTTLTRTSLRVAFEDGVQLDGKVLPVPDIELSLKGGQIQKSTKPVSILQIIVQTLGSFAR
jgi:hypothetical protein